MGYPLARRDPTTPQRDQEASETAKTVVGVAVVGGLLFLGYKFLVAPRLAQAQPAAPGSQPVAPPAPGQPGKLPPTPPIGPASIGDSAQTGDVILVSTDGVRSTFPAGALPPGVPAQVEMVVTGSQPGNAIVLARTTDNPSNAPMPAGFDAPVPRAAITMVTRSTPTPGQPSAPAVPPIVPNLPPIPGLPGGLPGGLPSVPGIPGLVPQDLGNPMTLQSGHHYRARLELGAVEAMLANPALVAQNFQSQGFTDVQVFHSGVDQLPADWPPATVVAASSNTYYAQGTWGGPTGPVPRPPQVAMAWEQ